MRSMMRREPQPARAVAASNAAHDEGRHVRLEAPLGYCAARHTTPAWCGGMRKNALSACNGKVRRFEVKYLTLIVNGLTTF